MAGRLTEFAKVVWVENANNPRPDNKSQRAPGLGQPWWNRGRLLSRNEATTQFNIDDPDRFESG